MISSSLTLFLKGKVDLEGLEKTNMPLVKPKKKKKVQRGIVNWIIWNETFLYLK